MINAPSVCAAHCVCFLSRKPITNTAQEDAESSVIKAK